MVATGIPPHMVIAGEVVKLKDKIHAMEQAARDNHTDTLKVLPELIVKAMEGRVRIEGQVDFSRSDMLALLSAMEDRLASKIVAHQGGLAESPVAAGIIDKDAVLEDNVTLWTYSWGGKFHPVSEGWSIDNKNGSTAVSTLTVKGLWELWFFGHAVSKLPPYRRLTTCDIFIKDDPAATKKHRNYYSNCKLVIEELLKVAIEQGNVASRDGACLIKMCITERDDVFKNAFIELNSRLDVVLQKDKLNRRVGEIKIHTYYNDVSKYKKSLR